MLRTANERKCVITSGGKHKTRQTIAMYESSEGFEFIQAIATHLKAARPPGWILLKQAVQHGAKARAAANAKQPQDTAISISQIAVAAT